MADTGGRHPAGVGGNAGQGGAAGETSEPVCWAAELSATMAEVGEAVVITIVPPAAQQPIPFTDGSSDEIGALVSDGRGGWQYVCRSEGTATIATARGAGCDDVSVTLNCVAGDEPQVSGDGGVCLTSSLHQEDGILFGTCSVEALKSDLEAAGPSSLGGGTGGEGGSAGANGSSGEQQGGAGVTATDCDPNGSWRIEFPNRGCSPQLGCQYYHLPPDFDLELEAPGQLTVSADGCQLHYIDGRTWESAPECGAVAYRVDLRIDGDSASGVLRGVESGYCNGAFRTTARAERVR